MGACLNSSPFVFRGNESITNSDDRFDPSDRVAARALIFLSLVICIPHSFIHLHIDLHGKLTCKCNFVCIIILTFS